MAGKMSIPWDARCDRTWNACRAGMFSQSIFFGRMGPFQVLSSNLRQFVPKDSGPLQVILGKLRQVLTILSILQE